MASVSVHLRISRALRLLHLMLSFSWFPPNPFLFVLWQTTALGSCWPASSAASMTCASCFQTPVPGLPTICAHLTTTSPRPARRRTTMPTATATATATSTAACSTPATRLGNAWSWLWRSQRCATTDVDSHGWQRPDSDSHSTAQQKGKAWPIILKPHNDKWWNYIGYKQGYQANMLAAILGGRVTWTCLLQARWNFKWLCVNDVILTEQCICA